MFAKWDSLSFCANNRLHKWPQSKGDECETSNLLRTHTHMCSSQSTVISLQGDWRLHWSPFSCSTCRYESSEDLVCLCGELGSMKAISDIVNRLQDTHTYRQDWLRSEVYPGPSWVRCFFISRKQMSGITMIVGFFTMKAIGHVVIEGSQIFNQLRKRQYNLFAVILSLAGLWFRKLFLLQSPQKSSNSGPVMIWSGGGEVHVFICY